MFRTIYRQSEIVQIENLHYFCYNIIKVIRVDNTKKFTNKADKYVSSRPSYPTKLMDYLYNKVGFSDKSKIADTGAGTGIFTRQLLERDFGRSLSASYSLTANDEKFDEYVKELNELFDKYEKNGIATVPNYTEVYIGEV